jgi:hypothetical protein
MSANPRYLATSAPASAPQSIDDLDLAIRTLAREVSTQTYRLLVLVRELDDRFGWQKWGLRNCAEWLAWRCDLSLSAAREKVRTAHALRKMPAVSAAFEDGRLSYSKVRALTRLVEYGDEETLLDYALRVTAAQLEERCREIRNSAPESVGTAWRAWEHRSLVISRDPVHGMLRMTVELPVEDGEVVVKAIERVAEAGGVAIGLEFAGTSGGVREGGASVRGARDTREASPNGWRAQQADALLAMAKASLAGNSGNAGSDGSHAGAGNTGCAGSAGDAVGALPASDNYLVVIHADDAALRGGVGRADLPVETLRRLTCDGSIVRVLEDHEGTPLDVGRKQRVVSTKLKRALWSRDRGCTFPGCRNRLYVDAHHVEHWTQGGETDIGNLMLLCSYHHRLVHEGGFTIRRDRDDRPYFVRPDGRVIPRSGYRLEDMVDDDIEGDGGENPAEGWVRSAARNPSAEVREGHGSYRAARRVYACRTPQARSWSSVPSRFRNFHTRSRLMNPVSAT